MADQKLVAIHHFSFLVKTFSYYTLSNQQFLEKVGSWVFPFKACFFAIIHLNFQKDPH